MKCYICMVEYEECPSLIKNISFVFLSEEKAKQWIKESREECNLMDYRLEEHDIIE